MSPSPGLASILLEHPAPDDQLLLHSVDCSISAGQAREQARAMAASLRDHGVEPGQAVAVQLPNSPQSIVAMVGVWLAGAVFVPVNRRYPPPEVERVLTETRPAAFVDEDGVRGLPDPRRYGPDDAIVLWTSGTTGPPKPIVQTHAAYLEMIDRVLGPLRRGAAPDPKRPPAPNLVPVSLALNAGIYNVVFGLRAGAEIVVMDAFATTTFADLVRRFGIRSTVLPPTAITMLNDDESIDHLAPLRFVRSITAPLSPLQAQRFASRFGVIVLNSYGQAEMGEVIGWTAEDAREHPDRVGAAGRPHPGVDLRVVDDDGVESDGVGRLFVRAPSMTKSASLAGRLDADGFLDTGDQARVDEAGFVWIEGRSSETINRGGNKVFPGQVEEVVRMVPGVVDVAVVGSPDPRLGAVPVAFVVVDGEVADAQLVAICRQHLAPYKVPTEFRRVDVLPRSEVGKVLRTELLGMLS